MGLLQELWRSRLKPGVISYSTAISVCDKGEQWEQALGLLQELLRSWLYPDVISYSAAISGALGLLLELRRSRLKPNVISHIAFFSACEARPAMAAGFEKIFGKVVSK